MPCTRKQYSSGGSGSMEFSPLRAGEGEGLASGKFWCTKRAESNVLQLILLNVYSTLVPPSIIMTKAARSTAIMCQTWEVLQIKFLAFTKYQVSWRHRNPLWREALQQTMRTLQCLQAVPQSVSPLSSNARIADSYVLSECTFELREREEVWNYFDWDAGTRHPKRVRELYASEELKSSDIAAFNRFY